MAKPRFTFNTHTLPYHNWGKLSPEEKDVLLSRERFVGGICWLNDYIISSSEDGTIRITAADGISKIIDQSEHAFNYIALNHNQQLLLACSDDGNIYLYETAHFTKVHKLTGLDKSGVRKASFSRAGHVIAGSNSGHLGIWHLESGRSAFFNDHEATVNAVAVHPEKEMAISNDMSGRTLIWDLHEMKMVKELTEKRGAFFKGLNHFGANTALWNHDFLILADDELRIYNNEFEQVHVIKGMAFAPSDIQVFDGILWAGGDFLKGWKTDNWEEVFSKRQKENIYSMDIDPDGILYTGDQEGHICVWAIKELLETEFRYSHGGSVTHVIDNKDYLVTSSDDKSIIVWNKDGTGVSRYLSNDSKIAVCSFISPHQIVIIENNAARLLNLESMTIEKEVEICRYVKMQYSFIKDNLLYFSMVCQFPRILNLENFTLEEIRFRTAIYHFSNIIDNKIIGCGYPAFPDEYKDFDLDKRKPDEELREAPVVLIDLETNQVIKEFWLKGTEIYGHWKKDSIYPSCAYQEKDWFIVGYSDGQIAKWRKDGDRPELLIHPAKGYVLNIHKTKNNDYVVSSAPDYPLMIIDENLQIVQNRKLSTNASIKYFDQEKNIAVVSEREIKQVLFFEADSQEYLGNVEYAHMLDKVYKSGEVYYIFGGGGCTGISS